MDIILAIKKDNARGKATSYLLLTILTIQTCCLVLISILDPFLVAVAEVFLILIETPYRQKPSAIIINFGLTILFLLSFALAVVLMDCRVKKFVCNMLASIIVIFKYIFLIPVAGFNLLQLFDNSTEIYLNIMAGMNLAVAVLVSFLEIYTNWSNRFDEVDSCNRRENSIIEFLLLLSVIFSTLVFNNLVGSIFLFALALRNLYQIGTVIESKTIQQTTISSSLIFLSTSVVCFVWFNKADKIQFQVITYQMFILLFVSKYSTERICNFINYMHCDLNKVLKINESCQENSLQQQKQTEDDFKSRNKNQDLILLARMLKNRLKVEQFGSGACAEWGLWWEKFNSIIVAHTICCKNAKCYCKKKQRDKESKILIDQMLKIMSNIQCDNHKEGEKVLSVYLYVEIAKKPLKGYYQIMKLKREKHSIADEIDLQCLIHQARICFDQIFLKNKVLNSNLPLLKIIEFEQLIHAIETEIRTGLEYMVNFIDLFTLSSVKIAQVLSESNNLFRLKKKINKLLQTVIIDYPDNLQVSVMVYVFFQYLEMYRSREKEFRAYSQEKMMKKRIFEKADEDIFDPSFGIIYIDLIEERGKIKKITKNVCQLYGHNVEDMISYNINQFMPRMFSKYHAKFLSNFIENGTIKILKEKKRVLFAKAKSKFIFPIQARIKTEHLFNNEFGATALVKKFQTHNDYIIVGDHGKIEEITESIYMKLFEPVFKSDVDKIRRMCAYKMIPNLVKSVKQDDLQSTINKTYESLFIFSDVADLAFEKFRTLHKGKKGSGTGGGNNSSRIMLSEYSETNSNFATFQTSSVDIEFCSQLFKVFLSDLNIVQLSGWKINYKLSKLKTEQFELLQIEIISIAAVSNPHLEIIQEFRKVSEYLQILEAHGGVEENLQKFKKIFTKGDVVDFMLKKNVCLEPQEGKRPANGRKKSLKTLKLLQNTVQFGVEMQSVINSNLSNSVDFLNDQDNNNIQQNMRGNSERSSITGSCQTQSRKQMFMNAFNSANYGLSFQMSCCLNSVIALMLTTLMVLALFSINGIMTMRDLQKQNNYYKNVTQIYEYRLAMSEIAEYFRLQSLRGLPNSSQLSAQFVKDAKSLNLDFTEKLKNINAQIKSSRSYKPLFEIIQIQDVILSQPKSTTFIELIRYLQYLFSNQNQPQNVKDLRVNYYSIHSRLIQIINKSYLNSKDDVSQLHLSQLILFCIYEFMVLLLALAFVPLLAYYRSKQKRILGLLSTMNLKELKKSKAKMRILWQNFKLSKINVLNNTLANLSNQKLDDNLDVEAEKSIVRNIKLTYEGTKNSYKQTTLILFILAFLIIFSLASVTYYTVFVFNEKNFNESCEILDNSYNLQNKAPLLVNVYLSNINRIYRHEPIFEYQSNLYAQIEESYFQMTEFISSQASSQKKIAESGSYAGLTEQICSQIDCTPEEQKNDLKLLYQILELRNKFLILSPSKIKIESGFNQTLLDQLSLENELNEALLWVDELYNFSQRWNLELGSNLTSRLESMSLNLKIFTGIVFPAYVALIFFIAVQLLNILSNIVKNAEHVHMHFPLSVLAENTYLTSYFNEKIKNNK